MPNRQKEEIGCLSKFERQKLHRFRMQGFAANALVHNLARAAKFSPARVRNFSKSKSTYTKFTQLKRKFKRMRDFAMFKNEIWCMDSAYIDKLAGDKNGVKYLVVRQDLFDGTVDAKRNEDKKFEGNCQDVFKIDYKKE